MRTRTTITAAAALAAVTAGAALPALTSAQTGEQVITAPERVKAITFVHQSKKTKGQTLAPGDRVLTRQAVFSGGGKRTGSLYTDCANVGPKANVFAARLLCTTTHEYPNGQIVAIGFVSLRMPTSTPIVGGTGAYRLARGTVDPGKPRTGYDSVDILRLSR